MKLETFSYLAPLTEAQIRGQVQYMITQGYAPAVEFTREPGPFNTYWSMWGLPMFDIRDAAAVIYELQACKKAYPDHYIKINGYDPSHQGQAVSFVAYRPGQE